MFTSSHFIWLGIIGIMIATALIILKKLKISDQAVGKAVMILLIVLKIFHLSLSMKESEFGGYIINQTQLSFHLCSIMIYSVIFSNIIKNNWYSSIVVKSIPASSKITIISIGIAVRIDMSPKYRSSFSITSPTVGIIMLIN